MGRIEMSRRELARVEVLARARSRDVAQPHEGPHDGDVHLYGALAVQHARKHGDALLSERVREITAAPAAPRL